LITSAPARSIRRPVPRLGQVEQVDQFLRATPGGPPAEVVEPAHHFQVLEAGQVFVDGRVLAGDADDPPHGPGVLGDVDAVDQRGAGIRPDQRGQHLDGRGLARAVRAEQRLHRSARNRQVEPVERPDGAALRSVGFGQARGFDDGHTDVPGGGVGAIDSGC
jgi:hypothetical protein